METADWLVPLIGCFGGIVLGLAARIGRFCSLSAIEDATFGAGYVRLLTWALAIGVSMLGVACLDMLGLIPVQSVFYLTNPVPLASTILGGIVFGIGMALVGTCGFGAVARLGGGDLSGLVVFLVIGITSYIASSGAIGVLRVMVMSETPSIASQSGFAHAIGATTGMAPAVFGGAAGLAIIVSVALRLRRESSALLWGALVGLVIVSGWAATSWHSNTSFGEVTVRSHSFVRPIGDTMIYAMTSSGTAISFGVASVIGVVIGAVVGALAKGEFRWEACDDARTLKRQILGAALMGIGGVFSLGCTIGQGLSAASVLAFSAPVAIASMIFGAWCGLHWLVHGSVLTPMRDILRRQ